MPTIEEYREIMGPAAEGLSDMEIANYRRRIRGLVASFIDEAIRKAQEEFEKEEAAAAEDVSNKKTGSAMKQEKRRSQVI